MRCLGLLCVLAACVGPEEHAAGSLEEPVVGPLLLGRVDETDPDAPRFAWPGTTIAVRFSGTSLSIELEDAGFNVFQVVVDGLVQPVLRTTAGEQRYDIATQLEDGEHEASITRRTESFFGATRLLGFPDTVLLEPPAAPTRWIEIVGDSISCGYGVLGREEGCDFSTKSESEPHAWGALAAAQLGAAHTTIAYSGIGVYRNYDHRERSTPTMPIRYGRIFADDQDSRWDFRIVPDVIVIALGTNDFVHGDPGAAFAEEYTRFLAQVRGLNPSSQIVLAGSSMLTGRRHDTLERTLDALAQASGDPRISVLRIPSQSHADGYGCDWHPGRTTHRKMAEALTAHVRAITGW